ncbi:hypothetical protein TARUN_6818 [Trichoderma arundinaceum]|uniref:Uncharacterized protein n=1 Tax=Trichoderma arundinaceum TaxID=490622 RepID=A0A395NHK6_TRIAR|nr:hypothetical protein TARUN_6818 [Trichoderma arundinaceum]
MGGDVDGWPLGSPHPPEPTGASDGRPPEPAGAPRQPLWSPSGTAGSPAGGVLHRVATQRLPVAPGTRLREKQVWRVQDKKRQTDNAVEEVTGDGCKRRRGSSRPVEMGCTALAASPQWRAVDEEKRTRQCCAANAAAGAAGVPTSGASQWKGGEAME